MSKYGMSIEEAEAGLRRVQRILNGRPGDCDGPDCYLHPDGVAHHVDPCPWYGTFNQAGHRLGDALQPWQDELVRRSVEFDAAAGRFRARLQRLRRW